MAFLNRGCTKERGSMKDENHCRDCCCANSWKALGITEYTGLSIPEHIERMSAVVAAAQNLLKDFGPNRSIVLRRDSGFFDLVRTASPTPDARVRP